MLGRPFPLLLQIVFASLVVLVQPVYSQHGHHDERALAEDPRLSEGQIAPILIGLGDHHHAVTTTSKRAQLFFDQGLKLTYAFNHQEALRSFKEAARLDPDCAMAYWGWALVLGPNLNLPMQEDVVEQAWEAVQLAVSHIDKVSEKEAMYIRALEKRYSSDPKAVRAALDVAYANAMRLIYERYPNDLDAATLLAAALMNISPWDYWTKDGQPRQHTPEILKTLESALDKDPYHEGALHYYIHAVEATHPKMAEPIADRLRGLAPGAGHLVHMPSHIYMQTGRYADAFEVNVLASQADESYIVQCSAQGIYPLAYYPHNLHFQTWASMMLGQSRLALQSARKVADGVPESHDDSWAIFQTFLSLPLYTMVRFGMWDAVLSEPLPPQNKRFWRGIAHYARALAYLQTKRLEDASRELDQLRAIRADSGTAELLIGFANAEGLLEISECIVVGEMAARNGEHDKAVANLERGVRLQSGLMYTEPPDWYFPVRHALGAVLLEAGRPKEAETVYWEDLKQYPNNGYSLFGLRQSLAAQGRTKEVDEIQNRLEESWKYADVQLTSSRY